MQHKKKAQMKQFKITSRDFRLEGDDSSLPDCYIDPEQLAEVKKLAGIDQLGIMARHQQRLAATVEVESQQRMALPLISMPVAMMSKNK